MTTQIALVSLSGACFLMVGAAVRSVSSVTLGVLLVCASAVAMWLGKGGAQ